MKSIFRLLALGAILLAGRGGLPAQAPPPVTQTVIVGGLTTQAPGQAWAYLFWQTDALDLIKAHSYSIWQKPGEAAAAGNFVRVGIVNLQSDPGAVAAIIQRATLVLGENPVELDQTVSSLFESLMPTLTEVPAGQRLAAKVAAVLRGVAADPRQLQSLLLASRYHPSIAMSAGQAYAAKIPSSGPVTFEVREYLAGPQTEAAVVGRVTVNHAAPVTLPVPTVVNQVPDLPEPGFNHLNLKLLWDTPDELRRLQPLTQGFNLYRVERATAEAAGHAWNVTPPAASLLAAMSRTAGSKVGRVNSAAIVARKMLTAAEVSVAQPGEQFFVDDAMRMPGYPAVESRPQNGDQYYYFVTTRDLLGRDHAGPGSPAPASPGLLATFCDHLMPDTPEGLKVTNDYAYHNGAPAQQLLLTWKGNGNAGSKKTTGYLVYRWNTTDGPLAPAGNPPLPISRDPMAHLIAGPIPHVDGQASFSYLDNGAGSPAITTDLNRTFWYTVRAVDNSEVDRPPGGLVCNASPFGGNLSPNSPSAYGTLRDRVGPGAPAGTVQILCPVAGIVALKTVPADDASLDPDKRYIDLTVTRPVAGENIAAVDFERQTGASTWVSLGRLHFTPGATSVTRNLVFAPGSLGANITVRARAVTATGETSAFAASSIGEPPALVLLQASWKATVLYLRVPVTSAAGAPRCPAHAPPDPGSGITAEGGNGVLVQFFPPPGTRQYKLYYRIDNGPLTLIREESKNFDGGQLLTVVGDVLPAVTTEVCLFLQVFDLDGNPSPMTALGCFPVKGSAALPKPMLAPIASSGSEASPAALLQWFCPPPGVEKFEVWISSSPSALPAALGKDLHQDAAQPTGTCMEKTSATTFSNFTYQVYSTERIGPAFGSGSLFTPTAPVMPGQTLRVKVRAVSGAGDAGPFSNVETYTWTPPPGFTGPDVPWPARPLPAIGDAAQFNASVAPFYMAAEGFVGITLGTVVLPSRTFAAQGRTVTQIKTTATPGSFLLTALFKNPDITRHALPCVLYRTQVPDVAGPGKPIANYPEVPGDVVQVSPLMESIAYATEPYPSGGTGISIYDPFIFIQRANLGEGTLNVFLLKDTTPVLSGARYLYLLVLLDPETREIERVLPLPTIDIP